MDLRTVGDDRKLKNTAELIPDESKLTRAGMKREFTCF